MRIARVLTRLNLGGPARQVLASDPLLIARGHQIRVLAGHPEPGEGDLFESLLARGIDAVRIPNLRRGVSPARDFLARGRITKELAAFRPDVVHTHASKAGTLGRAAVRRLSGESRIARVHTFHGHVLEHYFPPLISRRLQRHESRLALETDRIVAVSHATGDDLIRLGVVPEAKLVIVPPGVDLDELTALPSLRDSVARRSNAIRPLIGAAPDHVVAGVIGRLAEVKRVAWALDVFDLLAPRYPNLHLVFVGDGPDRRLIEQRAAGSSAAAQTRIHLLGARDDMPAVLADLDVVLLTSRSEGLPVALIEAGAAALPVVATNVGGVAEIIAHERTGLLGDTVDELAFALASLVDRPLERAAMGQRARLRVAERYGAAALAARLEALYLAVARERAAALDTGRPSA